MTLISQVDPEVCPKHAELVKVCPVDPEDIYNAQGQMSSNCSIRNRFKGIFWQLQKENEISLVRESLILKGFDSQYAKSF